MKIENFPTEMFDRIWDDFIRYIPEDFEPNSVHSDLCARCTLTATNPNEEMSRICYYKTDFPSIDIALDAEKFFKNKMYYNGRKQDEK